MHYRFDHAVILVADLDRATRDYTDLGFTVTPGGRHAGGTTHNALVAFADGSYLELLAYTSRWLWRALPWARRLGALAWMARDRPELERRFLLRSGHGEGLIDFALLPGDVRAEIARARGAGLSLEDPLPGGRTRPDGEEVSWELVIPRMPDLAFLCADVTPHERRVPAGAAREHPNGVTGVAGVIVAVHNLEASSARYRSLLGLEPGGSSPSAPSRSRSRIFALDGCELALAAPANGSDELRAQLRGRGEGPFSVQLRCAGAGPLPDLDPARTHGARLEAVREGRR